MTATATHRLRATLRSLTNASAVLIGAFALLTISLALALPAVGIPLEATGIGTDIDYTTAPHQHAVTLGLLGLLLSSIAYIATTNEEMSLIDLARSAIIGIGAAVLISYLISGTWFDTSHVTELLTLRPALTAIVGVSTIAYSALLRTRYDWLAINIAGVLLVPPILIQYAGYPLWILGGVLAVTAIADYIAVHRSGAMEQLASGLLSLRLPVAFLVPTTSDSLTDALDEDESDQSWVRGLRLLGMGDVVIPGVFIVALTAHFPGIISLPVVGALCGYLIGYAVLVSDPFENIAYAALPFLNLGVLLGAAITIPFV